jgi:nucleotide-binding universal stress UspA family protein
MKTIVVGYDGKEASRRALERALEIAPPEARLVVVAVAEVPLSPGMPVTDEFLDRVPVSTDTEELPEVEAVLAQARETLAARGAEADFVWAAGEPASAILEIAEERNADLVVIGEHHHSLLGRAFGVGREIEHGARCDVLVVRAGA